MKPATAINFSFQHADLYSSLPIILCLVTFMTYWFIANSEKIKNGFYQKFSSDQASMYLISFNRIVGFLSMGVIPAFFCLLFLSEYSLANYGLTVTSDTFLFTLVWTFLLAIVVIPFAYISAQKPKNLVNYPQIRTKTWTRKLVVIDAVGWALYLLGYEFLFRGILLFPLVDHLGLWPAVSINVALYSATHIPKGRDESIAAIPFGFVLCLLTLVSGTIWIAFFAHLVLALTNNFTALKFHPDIKFVKYKNGSYSGLQAIRLKKDD